MTDTQIRQTIALDLKRASKYLALGSKTKADLFLSQASDFWDKYKDEINISDKRKRLINLEREKSESDLEFAEKILLSASLLS